MVSTSYELSPEEAKTTGAGSTFSKEREALELLVRRARGGQGQALVVLGEAGAGKTTLIEDAVGSTPDLRIVRIRGEESECDLEYAALQRLCAPMLDQIDRLPGPRRDALVAALGVGPGSVNRLFVGLAVIGLLAEASASRPLICVIDDAHWLDPASMAVLAFVGRRLPSEGVSLVFSTRTPVRGLQGLPELSIPGLSYAEAHALVGSIFPGPLHARVRDRIVAESRGNLGALYAFADGLSPEHRAGGFGLPRPVSRTDPSIDALYEQLERLAPDTERLLVVAASEPEGDLALFWRVMAALGIQPATVDEAVSLGLLELGVRVTFRDPTMRSVAYHHASSGERRLVHQALADMSGADLAPDRCSWHASHATLGADEEIAGALERSVGHARMRGGLAAASAFLERSAVLTPDAERRAERALAAANAKFEAGALEAAAQLLSLAADGDLDEYQHAQVERLRANLSAALRRGDDVSASLLESAQTLERFDVQDARDTYLQALDTALTTGCHDAPGNLADAARAARAAAPAKILRAADLLLDGLAILFTDGYTAAAPILQHAVQASRRQSDTRWLGLACRTAAETWDSDATLDLASRWIRRTRETGALAELPSALDYLAAVQVHAGELRPAARLVEDAQAIAEMIGQGHVGFGALVLAAWRGSEAEAAELIEAQRLDAVERSDGRQIAHTKYAAAVLYNGLGRYHDAIDALQPACEREELFSSWVLPELVEAAARCGRSELAGSTAERLDERTRACGTELALGIRSRSLALLTAGSSAESLYRDAIERLGDCRASAHRARAHLVYGEWLRRERRRVDAREQLRIARDLFSAMDARAFTARAQRELLATGERTRKRSVETTRELTPQEAEIARLARDGSSNPQIAARLFISARTVEYHLHKVFVKLAITSRAQLVSSLVAGPESRPLSGVGV
ncbi:MAG TPA: AAA family ATPase [Acidimicrobiia bacterium]